MRTQFKTKNGSVYEIDHEAKTWRRLNATEASGPLRTDSGPVLDMDDLEIGECALIVGPPLVPGMSGRMILTSPVTEILTVIEEVPCADHDVEC